MTAVETTLKLIESTKKYVATGLNTSELEEVVHSLMTTMYLMAEAHEAQQKIVDMQREEIKLLRELNELKKS